MITVEVSTAGLEFSEVAETLSGPLLQQFLEQLADIGYTAAFWGAPQSGDMVFTKLVNHPGTSPNPFMHNAAETARSKVGETFAELWLELI